MKAKMKGPMMKPKDMPTKQMGGKMKKSAKKMSKQMKGNC
jgi:hypothetical protein